MARNRQRAKARKQRQQQGRSAPRKPPEASSGEVEGSEARDVAAEPESEELKGDLDAAQAAAEGDKDLDAGDFEAEVEDVEAEDAEADDDEDAEDGDDAGDVEESRDGRVVATAATPKGAPIGTRLANFARGCVGELQRVQWPDRRAVGQATAVVFGFVVIAGAFLGLADTVAQKIIDLII
jgi:preprotein translocase SecE subunit